MNDYTFTHEAFEQFRQWQQYNKKIAQRISDLLEDIRRNGAMQGIGKPERLKYRDAYFRRIDDANRLVYRMDELGNIKIVSCRGHYDDR